MPCPFTGPKMFCAGLNFLSQPKNLTAFSASSKPFVPAQKPILLNANHLWSGTKFFWLPQYVNKFLVKHKTFGPAQNILGPVKGQGIIQFLESKVSFSADISPIMIYNSQICIWIVDTDLDSKLKLEF